MTLQQLTRKALSVTSAFEGGGFGTVTGNFDGQGLSCGALQWAFGQGTQQKLVKEVEEVKPGIVVSLMPNCGKDYLLLCSMKTEEAMLSIQKWSQGGKLIEPYKSELMRLWSSVEMVEIQVESAMGIGNKAYQLCSTWNNSEPTAKEFCFYRDWETRC